MATVYYRTTEAALIVFDMTRETTLQAVLKWKNVWTGVRLLLTSPKELTKHVSDAKIPILIVGNKMDCPESIPDTIVDKFCRENGLTWVKVSAKDNQNV